ncbi:MAG: hypothetical protein O3A46_10695, partial [Candidatus Poribacteria bacterium]|nr:hypothetical protein [Candidatus Poribacteria bacterium]
MSFSRSARWTLGVVLASVLVSYAASALTWEMTTGPYGGTVYCLWQAENGVVYAGTDSGELYRSESRGESWSYMATVSDRSILSMAIKNNVFYIGTDGAGVWRSLDEGKTWEEMDRLSLLNPTVRALVVYH